MGHVDIVQPALAVKNVLDQNAIHRVLKRRLFDPVIKLGDEWLHFSQLVLWIHPQQKGGRVRGRVIYDHLRRNGMIELCLNLLSAPVIIGSGLVVFRDNFGSDTALFLWGSADESLVPCIFRDGNELKLGWHSINSFFFEADPAVQFPKEDLERARARAITREKAMAEQMTKLTGKKTQLLLPASTQTM